MEFYMIYVFRKSAVLSLSYALLWLYNSVLAAHVDESKLKRTAEEMGYGYKYANLTELENLVPQIKQIEHDIKIPEFVGLSSQLMQDFLKTYVHLDIADQWQKIVNEFYSDELSIQNAFSSKKFKAGFLAACADLENTIVKAINDFNNKPEHEQLQALKLLFSTSDTRQKKASALLNNLRKSNERLMVRSSGREDSKTLANAGGNLSVANVNPNLSSAILAMGEVVASYFGKTSLKQRLGAGDESLFDKKSPLTPVILQRMIAERDPHFPTKCGVMFTEEPEGAIFDKPMEGQKKRTNNITLIQSAYGHNEAVVNSRVTVDTYYVDEAYTIFPVIRPKTHRMVPSKHEKILDLKENPEELINKGSLSAAAVQDLKSIAKSLEDFYLEAMDVEFVLEPAQAEHKAIIYLVQARPIVLGKKVQPSFIINAHALEGSTEKSGITIVNAGGALRLSKGLDQIIRAKNINTALSNYFDEKLTPNQNEIEGVIIGKMAPATSHEASTFRSEGKPVIYMHNLAEIEKWLGEQQQKKHLISPQQGLLVNYVGKENTVAKLITTAKIAQVGWVNYPIPELLSLYEEYLPPLKEPSLQEPEPRFRKMSPKELIMFAAQASKRRSSCCP
jgi:phosphoenolpyruvate synthase/pyruvate phosphate dikinase